MLDAAVPPSLAAALPAPALPEEAAAPDPNPADPVSSCPAGALNAVPPPSDAAPNDAAPLAGPLENNAVPPGFVRAETEWFPSAAGAGDGHPGPIEPRDRGPGAVAPATRSPRPFGTRAGIGAPVPPGSCRRPETEPADAAPGAVLTPVRPGPLLCLPGPTPSPFPYDSVLSAAGGAWATFCPPEKSNTISLSTNS